MKDFLTFRKMIAPTLIQILFWLATIGVIGAGFACIMTGLKLNDISNIEWYANPGVLSGILIILLGPLCVRLSLEVAIVLFNIYKTLVSIQKTLQQYPDVSLQRQVNTPKPNTNSKYAPPGYFT